MNLQKGISRIAGSLALIFVLSFTHPLLGASAKVWEVPSPDHGQTFTFGSESKRVWTSQGEDHCLSLLLNYTNDPYVDRINPRQYDYFTFNFPQVILGKDGKTFYYQVPGGKPLAVAVKKPDFFGVGEIRLLPNAYLVIQKPHGYLSLKLVVSNPPFERD